MLEEIGIEWGEKRLTTSWDARFEDLLAFKSRYGHVNVPWQWKENVSLAQWVNSQRKKYKDLGDGKRNNLSPDQITRLNGIGEFVFVLQSNSIRYSPLKLFRIVFHRLQVVYRWQGKVSPRY